MTTEQVAAAASAARGFLLAGERLRHATAAYLGLAMSDTAVMGHLGADGPLSPGDLAHRVNLSASTLTAVIDRLESRGLVRRTLPARDRRRTLVALTTEGETLHTQMRRSMLRAVAHLDQPDLAQLTRDLTTLTETLHAQIADLTDLDPPRHRHPVSDDLT